jgi:hypothetical protein
MASSKHSEYMSYNVYFATSHWHSKTITHRDAPYTYTGESVYNDTWYYCHGIYIGPVRHTSATLLMYIYQAL